MNTRYADIMAKRRKSFVVFFDVAASPDGRVLVAAGSDGALHLWEFGESVVRVVGCFSSLLSPP
jgi:WD40 repeat protein